MLEGFVGLVAELAFVIRERAKIGSFERDLRTGDVFWSDETYRIFGRDPSTPPPTREELLTIIDPEDRANFEASMAASE